MKSINFLIKPVSSMCQFSCKYCFYKDVSSYQSNHEESVMSYELAKKIISEAMTHTEPGVNINFGFQGGEPTLAGIEYYKNFVKLVDEMKSHQKVHYSLQTNGYLINDEWCKFFKENHFLIGISLDGFKDNHDYYRLISKNPTYDTVYKAIQKLDEYGIPFNILTVLTKSLCKRPKELYEFYKKENFEYIQFIPCIDDINNKTPYATSGYLLEQFYKKFYIEWLRDLNHQNMHISLFDDLLNILNGQLPLKCGTLGMCQPNFIVESNGDFYPCDFYAIDQYKMGNILDASLEDLSLNNNYRLFNSFDNTLHNTCKNCKYRGICNGNCKRMRYLFVNGQKCNYRNFIEFFIKEIKKEMNRR